MKINDKPVLFFSLLYLSFGFCWLLPMYTKFDITNVLYFVMKFPYVFHIAAIQTALAVAMSEDTSEATNSTSVIVTEEVEETSVDSTSIQWNIYTATGWISCIIGLFNLLLFFPCTYKVSLLYSLIFYYNSIYLASQEFCSRDKIFRWTVIVRWSVYKNWEFYVNNFPKILGLRFSFPCMMF